MLSVDLEAQSPILILPSPQKFHVAFFDLGRLSIRDQPARHADDEVFDEFQVATSRMRAFTMDTSVCDDWRDSDAQRQHAVYLIDHLAFVIMVARNSLHDDPSRPQFKLRASLPNVVRVHLSHMGMNHLQSVLVGDQVEVFPTPTTTATPPPADEIAFLADTASEFNRNDEESDTDSIGASRNEDFFSLADEFERSVSRRSRMQGTQIDDSSSFCTANSGGLPWRKAHSDSVVLALDIDIERIQIEIECDLARQVSNAENASQSSLIGTPTFRRSRYPTPEPTPRPSDLPVHVETWLAELEVRPTPDRASRQRSRLACFFFVCFRPISISDRVLVPGKILLRSKSN